MALLALEVAFIVIVLAGLGVLAWTLLAKRRGAEPPSPGTSGRRPGP